jgi:carbon-monoxide dehydrogenase medium subunit
MSRNFDYHRASSAEEAVALKGSLGSGARLWAGGTDLMLWDRRKGNPITAVIDITGLRDLAEIEVTGDRIRIGALASLALIERSGGRHPNLRVLAETARIMCTPQTRTIASIGGNICNASPGADLIPPLVALGAVMRLRGADGARQLSLEQFVTGVGQNDLAGDEMLTHIAIDNGDARSACTYRRVARTAVDIALVSAATYFGADESGKITTARISLGAVSPRPVRCLDAELMLVDSSLDALTERRIAGIAAVAGGYANPITDIRASKSYRAEMCAVLARRCLEDCVNNLKQKARA